MVSGFNSRTSRAKLTLMKFLIPVLIVVYCLGCTNATVENKEQREDSIIVKPSTDSLVKKDTVIPANGSQEVFTGDLEPDSLVSFAETLLGVPYKYASTDPEVGFDCSGFITYVFTHFGINVPRSSKDFENVGHPVLLLGARRGDLILFTGTDTTDRTIGHMGIITSNIHGQVHFIHSSSGKANGVTITPLNEYYLARYVKSIRVFNKE